MASVASSSEEGRRISEAKKGRLQVALGLDETTLKAAVEATGYSRKVLQDGVDDRTLSHLIVDDPRRPYLIDRAPPSPSSASS
jgi:hypothetical protein